MFSWILCKLGQEIIMCYPQAYELPKYNQRSSSQSGASPNRRKPCFSLVLPFILLVQLLLHAPRVSIARRDGLVDGAGSWSPPDMTPYIQLRVTVHSRCT